LTEETLDALVAGVAIYQAPSEAAARAALADFETSPLGRQHPSIGALWHRH
jgi:transposase-like protein